MIRKACAVRDLRVFTEGKYYKIIDIQDGIFASNPYIGVINDDNKVTYCHHYRLDITAQECYDYIQAKYNDQLPEWCS